MKKRYRLYGRNREVFLNGLQRYQERGIPILIDGKRSDSGDWIRLLEEQPDGSFYMGDYVMEEPAAGEPSIVCEDIGSYDTDEIGNEDGGDRVMRENKGSNPVKASGCMKLKEIRFDRVYNR